MTGLVPGITHRLQLGQNIEICGFLWEVRVSAGGELSHHYVPGIIMDVPGIVVDVSSMVMDALGIAEDVLGIIANIFCIAMDVLGVTK